MGQVKPFGEPLEKEKHKVVGNTLKTWRNFHKILVFILVLACSGCYSKNTVGWVTYNNRFLFLIIPEAGKFKIKAPADLVAGEKCACWFIDAIFSPSPHMLQGMGALWGFFFFPSFLLLKYGWCMCSFRVNRTLLVHIRLCLSFSDSFPF